MSSCGPRGVAGRVPCARRFREPSTGAVERHERGPSPVPPRVRASSVGARRVAGGIPRRRTRRVRELSIRIVERRGRDPHADVPAVFPVCPSCSRRASASVQRRGRDPMPACPPCPGAEHRRPSSGAGGIPMPVCPPCSRCAHRVRDEHRRPPAARAGSQCRRARRVREPSIGVRPAARPGSPCRCARRLRDEHRSCRRRAGALLGPFPAH